jgi:hypothetical protein
MRYSFRHERNRNHRAIQSSSPRVNARKWLSSSWKMTIRGFPNRLSKVSPMRRLAGLSIWRPRSRNRIPAISEIPLHCDSNVDSLSPDRSVASPYDQCSLSNGAPARRILGAASGNYRPSNRSAREGRLLSSKRTRSIHACVRIKSTSYLLVMPASFTRRKSKRTCEPSFTSKAISL